MIPTCKTCRYWTAEHMVCRKRALVDVPNSEREFKPDTMRVFVYYPSANGTPHVHQVFTGPDYGCVHHKEAK